MNLNLFTATQTAFSSTQTTLRIGEDMARRREEDRKREREREEERAQRAKQAKQSSPAPRIATGSWAAERAEDHASERAHLEKRAELGRPLTAEEKLIQKVKREDMVKFEKERDAVQGSAYKLAKEQGPSGSTRPLVESMDAILDEELQHASGYRADRLKAGRSRPSLDKRSEAFGHLLESMAIHDPQRRRDGLITYEALRMTAHLRDPQIADMSKKFKNEARGDNRRLDPEKFRANMSEFLTGQVQSAKKRCLEQKDKDGAMFTNAALKRLGAEETKPVSLRTLAIIADRTGRIVGKHHPGIAKPLIAAQFTSIDVDQVQRAKAKRMGRDQGA